jgi:hypothetical protein
LSLSSSSSSISLEGARVLARKGRKEAEKSERIGREERKDRYREGKRMDEK